MTTTTTAPALPAPINVAGPYSPWPRRAPRATARRLRVAGAVTALGGAGVFVHCALPLIV